MGSLVQFTVYILLLALVHRVLPAHTVLFLVTCPGLTTNRATSILAQMVQYHSYKVMVLTISIVDNIGMLLLLAYSGPTKESPGRIQSSN